MEDADERKHLLQLRRASQVRLPVMILVANGGSVLRSGPPNFETEPQMAWHDDGNKLHTSRHGS